ncbi:MAG: STAS-like domain-containing protein [Candidatus Moraniibacteriota bacterium]
MIHINLFEKVGAFAENKDIARSLRLEQIIPALEKNQAVVLDFEHVDAATQSFVHALISDLIRKYGREILDKISFKSCNEKVQKIIMIVSEYMQEGE